MNNPVKDAACKPNQTCNGVVIYEDKATETRARNMLEAIFDEMGLDIPYAITSMTVAQMAGMPVCEGAAMVDFVIISVHDVVRRVSDGKWWLTHWLNESSRMPRALFLLHDGEEKSGWVRGMRTLAESAGVNLFSRGRLASAGIPVRPSVPEHQPEAVEV